MLTKNFAFLTIIPLVLIVAGCDQVPSVPKITNVSESAYRVDPLFREFYDKLDGANTLGDAISSVIEEGGIRCQYTVAGLMVFDPKISGPTRIHLAPLGVDMGYLEPPISRPDRSDVVYVDGHVIFQNFINLYDKLGGPLTVGKPLTEMHYNPEKRRYEQYFENLGFYILAGDPPEKARLLPYGAWNCDQQCRTTNVQNNILDAPPKVNPFFEKTVENFGRDFTGFPLTEAYVSKDGRGEQIFENVVLTIDVNDQGSVSLRNMVEEFGDPPEPLVAASGDPNMFFYPLQADLGHNVPLFFLDYITAHGGIEISGAPVSELKKVENNILRQCFQNLCLDYDQDGHIRPQSLGYTYKALFFHATMGVSTEQDTEQSTVQPTQSPTPAERELRLQVWATNELVRSDQTQDIWVSVMENNTPLINIEPVLTVMPPGDDSLQFSMPPTGVNGQTHFLVPPIPAKNGTLINFQVCIPTPNGERYCYMDNYVIWNEP
jgi:hypothetical protein